MKKRLLSALLTFCMLLTLLPVSVLATEYRWPGDDDEWSPAPESATLTPEDESYGFDGGHGDDIHLSKTAKDNGDGTYTVTLSATADALITAKPTEVVFVIDGSGSMNWCEEKPDDGDTGWIGKEGEWQEGKKGQQDWTSGHYHGNGDHGRDGVYCTYIENGERDSRWEIALDAIDSMMNDLGNEGVSYQFVVYNGRQKHNGEWVTQAISYDDFDDVKGIDPLGGTPLVKGVNEALDCFNSGNSNKVMIIVADGASDDNDYPSTRYGDFADFRDDTENNEVYTVGFTFSNDDFEDLATDGDHAFLATNPGELENSMKEISQNIKGLITDPLGKDVELVDDDINVEVSGGQDSGRYWVTGDTINWTCEDGLNGTVTLTYTVRIKDDVVDKAGHYRIPLNDQATLNYSYEMYGYSESHSVDFPEPEAEFDAATLTVKYKLENKTVDTKSEWVKVEDGAAFETEIPEKDDEYTHNNKTYWVDRVEGSVDTPLETKDYEVTVYLTDDEPDHGSDITPTAHPITIEVVLDGDMSDRKTDSEVGNYIDVNPFQNNTDNGEAAWDEGTYHSDSGTVTYSITYYDCKDIGFEANPGYVIEAIDADLVFGQSGCEGIYSTAEKNKNQDYGDYMADNVQGGSTVTVYVRTAYTVEYYLDGVALNRDPYNDSTRYVADTTGLEPIPGDAQNPSGSEYSRVDCNCANEGKKCTHDGLTDSEGGQPEADYLEVFDLNTTIELPSLPDAETEGNVVSGWYESNDSTSERHDQNTSVNVADHTDRVIVGSHVIPFYALETTPDNPELTVTKTVVSVGGTAVDNQDNIPEAKVGDTIVYQIVVENTGNVALEDISVTDPLTGALYTDSSCTDDVIASDATNFDLSRDTNRIFYAKYQVTANDAGKQLVNTATASVEDGPEDSGSVTVNVKDQHTLTVEYYYEEVKQENQFTPEGVTTTSYTLNEGDSWTIAITNTNAGSVEGVTHVAPETVKRTVGDVAVNYMFDEDATIDNLYGTMEDEDVVVQLIYTKDSIGTHENPDTPDDVPDKYQVTILYQASEGGSIAEDAKEKEVLTINVDGSPSKNGTVTASGSTAVETEGYFFSNWTHNGTAAESADGSSLNSATFSEFPLTVTGGDVITFTANFTAKTFAIDVEKVLASVGDTTIGPNTDIPKAKVGENIIWTITVTNNGNQILNNIKITDTMSGDPAGTVTFSGTDFTTNQDGTITISTLAANGGSVTITATYTVQSNDAGKTLNNTAVAEVTGTPGDTDTPEQPVTVEQTGLTIVKSATVNGQPLGSTVALGTTINYQIVVTNTGNVDLHNVVVSDSLWDNDTTVSGGSGTYGPDNDGKYVYTIGTLAAQTSVTLTYQYKAETPDTLTNTATVTSDEVPTPDPSTVTTTVSDAEVVITKDLTQVNGEDYNGGTVKVDDVLTYTITVTNNSGVDLTGVTVTDVFTGAGEPDFSGNSNVDWDSTTKTATWNVGTVAANGGSATLTYTYTVLDGDEGNTITNTAIAEGDQIDNDTPPTSEEEVIVSDRFTLIYDANGGSFGNNEETLTIPNLPEGNYILTETQGYTAPTYGKYVLIGWSETQSEDVIGAGEEIPDCTPDVTLNDANPSQTVYAVWGEDANKDGVADAQQIVIRPADITIYTGGDGYEGVVEDDSGEMVGSQTNQGLPEPGYYLVLPHELNEDLRGNSSTTGAVDLSQHLRFSYGTDRIWVLELYNPNSYSMAYDYYIYQMVPQVAGQDPVRLEIKKDDGTYVTDDDFTIALDTLYQEYEMKLYTGEVEEKGITVQISVNGEDWKDVAEAEVKGICAIEGDLTVRGTNSNDPTTSIESSVTSPVDVITAEAGDVTYYINDSDIPVVNQDDVALLSDELVGAGVDTLLAEAEDRLGLAWYEDYEYQTQYLDLVDTSNGNAYVTLGAGDSVDIHWPMPNGTSRWNTEFYVVHFDGLDRNFDDLDARLDSGNVDLQVYTLGNGLRIENGNLVFTTDTFSPFVLIWQDSDRDWPDDDDDDDNDRPSHDDDDDNDRPEQEDPAPELDKESHIAYVSGTPEGTIEPNAYITREEVATIFFRLLTDRSRANYITDYNPFPDVDSSRWSFYPIVTMNNAGIMHGYDDGNFAPSGYITRAEFAVVAAQFSDAEYTGADLFSDISGHWAREYINRAASEGWISGYPDGSFGPDDYITRAQVMALVNEVLDRAPDADYMLDDMITWPDNADESAWYYEDVQEATNSHSYVWRNSGRTSEEWEDLIDTRTLDELVRDAFNGVGISY